MSCSFLVNENNFNNFYWKSISIYHLCIWQFLLDFLFLTYHIKYLVLGIKMHKKCNFHGKLTCTTEEGEEQIKLLTFNVNKTKQHNAHDMAQKKHTHLNYFSQHSLTQNVEDSTTYRTYVVEFFGFIVLSLLATHSKVYDMCEKIASGSE